MVNTGQCRPSNASCNACKALELMQGQAGFISAKTLREGLECSLHARAGQSILGRSYSFLDSNAGESGGCCGEAA